MRYGSVCSGVEAASLAWESLGWQPAWFAEIEPFPAAVLNYHWPHVPNHGDMTQLEARILSGEIEAPDILVGGTPCQAFSVAGFGDFKRRNQTRTLKRTGGAIGGGSETLVVHGRQDPCVSDKAFCLDNQGAGNTNVVVTVPATLSTGFGSRGLDSEQFFNGNCVIDYPSVRRLTPLECERLQGFPDGHTQIPWRGKPAEECPDAPRYKACGNSMAVPCMRWIGQRISKTVGYSEFCPIEIDRRPSETKVGAVLVEVS